MMKDRSKRNLIISVASHNGSVEGVQEVKEAIKSSFESRFVDILVFEGIDLKKLLREESVNLEVEFTK